MEIHPAGQGRVARGRKSWSVDLELDVPSAGLASWQKIRLSRVIVPQFKHVTPVIEEISVMSYLYRRVQHTEQRWLDVTQPLQAGTRTPLATIQRQHPLQSSNMRV